jgi:ParB family chromosome partitioning protein
LKEQLARLLGLDNNINPKDEIKEIPLQMVAPNPYQPRISFADAELEELAASINRYGVLQPVVVRAAGNGYELVAGERRLRACKLLGLATIPAIIKELSDQDLALLALVENLQREDLKFLEEAQSYQQLLTEFGFTQEELAQKLGKSQSTIANKLRLLKLSSKVRAIISREIITERHARALLKLNQEDDQLLVISKIVAEGLTVQDTETYITKLLEDKNKSKPEPKQKVIRVYKDIRIFLNTIRRAVQELQQVGFPARFHQEEKEDCYEITVVIPKNRRVSK